MVTWLEARTKTAREDFRWHEAGPIAVADALGLLAPDVLLVHLTDARSEELERVARSGAHVVLCPRSNLFIETRLPPLAAMRRAGIAPALGTDSLASCPTLDVLAEAKALHERFPQVSAHEILAMATLNGARALDLEASLGSLVAGKRPGVLLVEGGIPAGLDPAVFALRQPMSARRMLVAPAPRRVSA
jgi:cytosine/adenosine deaminase-related metal-dependent hydrolase